MDLASFVQTRRRAQTSIAARAIRMLYSIFPHSSRFGRHNLCKRARRRLLEQFDRRVDYINEMNVNDIVDSLETSRLLASRRMHHHSQTNLTA